jgi:hypothetical protein
LGFLSSLFGGSSSNLNHLIDQYGQIGQSQTGQGQKYENKAGDFWSNILSGNSSKTMQALSPEISAAKTRSAQDRKTATMFGGRSGGTAASNAASTDKLHSDITNLVGSLTGSSASNLANLGSTLTSTGLSSLNMQEAADARRMQNWSDSILGRGITTAVAAGEGYALGG